MTLRSLSPHPDQKKELIVSSFFFLLYSFWGSAAILFRLCDNSFQAQRQSFQAQPQFFYFETGWCIRKIRAVTVISAALFYVSLL